MPRSGASGRARREVSAGGVLFRLIPHGPQLALIKANGRWGFPKGNIVLLDGDAAFNPQLSEIEEAQWVTPAEARRVISFKNSRETLDATIAGLEAGQVAS